MYIEILSDSLKEKCYARCHQRKEQSTMKQSEEKFNTWITNAVKGKGGYEVVLVKDNDYICKNGDYVQKVTSLIVIAWKDGKLFFCYQWKEGENKENIAEMAFVIKKQKKMMLYINSSDARIYNFGLGDTEGEEINVLIFYQVQNEITLIAASSKSEEIKMINAIQNEDNKAMQWILGQIETSLQSQMEVEKNTEEAGNATEL